MTNKWPIGWMDAEHRNNWASNDEGTTKERRLRRDKRTLFNYRKKFYYK